MAQIMLGLKLEKATDAAGGYYRSRPLLLALDVPIEEALASSMGRAAAIRTGAISASCSTIRGSARQAPSR
jgi:2-oxoisovalerate dehydrogenase E1 component